ncbi:MAG: hypothetical protein K0R63_1759 [Rickettsiales bacterium]|jgi:hypothetical protein|nr:hypothetical protein [Rickettsiales bacterium]
MDEENKYRRELEELRFEHTDLDRQIERMTGKESFDQLRVQRLKKRKLWIRDRTFYIEKLLYPDIIA